MVWENQVADTGSRNGVERWTDRSCDRREKNQTTNRKTNNYPSRFSSTIIDPLSG